MEQMMNKKIEKKEKQLQTQRLIVESDGIFLDGLGGSVETVIKNNAISKYPFYQQFDPNKQSIICLGLNSILSADFPESQSILFNKKQWRDLKRLFSPKLFDTESYDVIGDI
ncbi:hypothetical protein RMATCC62417_14362 [Rhizopus microsporus]|nr:hypothetical protein RMATCC62417_14362 [Rhizopus microsporus]